MQSFFDSALIFYNYFQQTNLLIYGPGGYKYVDFLRIGTPMQVVLWILSIIFISVDPSRWYLSWVATGLVLLIVSIILVFNENVDEICSKFKTRRRRPQDDHTL